jgi:VWFA-related protein
MHWRNARQILLGATIGAAIPLLVHARQDDQIFKSGAELVVLHVNVFDKRSDAVPELPQSAFTVFEDDKPQEIEFFSAGDVPVTVGLVVDNSTSMLTEREMVVSGATAFAESSHPEDEMFAIVFNEYVRTGLPETIDFTKNRLQLRASLQRFTPGGKTAFYDAVIAGLDHLEQAGYQKRRPRRKQPRRTATAREAVGGGRLLSQDKPRSSREFPGHRWEYPPRL